MTCIGELRLLTANISDFAHNNQFDPSNNSEISMIVSFSQ